MQGLDAAPVAFVDTLPALQAAAARLAASRELAVDLEHHSYRSYQARAALPYPCSRAQARGRLGRVCPCVPLRRGLVLERGLAASDVRILGAVCWRMVQQPSFSCVRTFEHPCARMCVRTMALCSIVTLKHAGVWLPDTNKVGRARRARTDRAACARAGLLLPHAAEHARGRLCRGRARAAQPHRAGPGPNLRRPWGAGRCRPLLQSA